MSILKHETQLLAQYCETDLGSATADTEFLSGDLCVSGSSYGVHYMCTKAGGPLRHLQVIADSMPEGDDGTIAQFRFGRVNEPYEKFSQHLLRSFIFDKSRASKAARIRISGTEDTVDSMSIVQHPKVVEVCLFQKNFGVRTGVYEEGAYIPAIKARKPDLSHQIVVEFEAFAVNAIDD